MHTPEELRILNGYTLPEEAQEIANRDGREGAAERGEVGICHPSKSGSLYGQMKNNHRHVQDLERRLQAADARIAELNIYVEILEGDGHD